MKERLKILPMKALAAFCLLLGLSPVFVTVGFAFFPDAPLLWYLPPVACWLLGVCAYLFPGKGRMYFAFLSCAGVMLWAALYLLPLGWQKVLFAVPCVVYLLLLPPAWARPEWEEWSASLWLGGCAVHALGLILSGTPRFSPVAPHIAALLAAYVFFFAMSLNRMGLRDGMHGAGKIPAALRHRNTALVTGFFLLALIAAFWNTLGVWLDWLWRQIKTVIGAVLDFIMRLLPQQSSSGGGGGGMGDMLGELGEGAEPSPFALFMEKVFYGVAALLLMAVLYLALRSIFKAVKPFLRRWLDRLRRYSDAAGEDYVDEAESTVNWEEKTQSVLSRLQNAVKRPRLPKWEELDGRARVRRLYQQFLRKKPENKAQTAREAIRADQRLSRAQAQDFTRLYETARYSDHEVSAQEADQLRNAMKM